MPMPSMPGHATPLVAVNVRINPEVKADLDRYCQTLGINMRQAIEDAVASLVKGMQASGGIGDAASQPEKPAEGVVFRNVYRQGPDVSAADQGV
jgi:hypothetical protein